MSLYASIICLISINRDIIDVCVNQFPGFMSPEFQRCVEYVLRFFLLFHVAGHFSERAVGYAANLIPFAIIVLEYFLDDGRVPRLKKIIFLVVCCICADYLVDGFAAGIQPVDGSVFAIGEVNLRYGGKTFGSAGALYIALALLLPIFAAYGFRQSSYGHSEQGAFYLNFMMFLVMLIIALTSNNYSLKNFFKKKMIVHFYLALIGLLQVSLQLMQSWALSEKRRPMRIAKYMYFVILVQFVVDAVLFKQKFKNDQWIAWAVILIAYILKHIDRHGTNFEGGNREPLLNKKNIFTA